MNMLNMVRHSIMMLVLAGVLVIPINAQATKVKVCIEFDEETGICIEYSDDDDEDNDDDLDDDFDDDNNNDDDDKKCKNNRDSESDDC